VSSEAFEQFRGAVLADPALQDELLDTKGRREFVVRATERAQALGFAVEPDDLEAALRTARQDWNRRWV
jgi:hypothetical protein